MSDDELLYEGLIAVHRAVEAWCDNHFPNRDDNYFRGILRGSAQGLRSCNSMWKYVQKVTGLTHWRAKSEALAYFKQIAEESIDG